VIGSGDKTGKDAGDSRREYLALMWNDVIALGNHGVCRRLAADIAFTEALLVTRLFVYLPFKRRQRFHNCVERRRFAKIIPIMLR
jgi:hypothetical protein